MEQQMEQYCRKVRTFLQCPPADARRCIDDVQRTAERLRQEAPEISQDEIEDFLGEPKEVTRMFQDTLDQVRVERYRRRRKLFFGALIGGLALFAIVAVGVAYYYFVTPQMTYDVEFYSSEPIELAPDDPRAACLYE